MGKEDLRGGGYLVYKCRRCGKLDKSTHSPNLMSDVHSLVIVGVGASKGIPVRMLSSHICKDGNLGVTDFIGGEFDKEDE